MRDKIKSVLLSIAAIIAGVAIALLVALPMLLLSGFFVFSDSEVAKGALLLHTTLLTATAMVSGFVAGFICNKIYISVLYLNSIVTALLLIFLWLWVNDFELQYMSMAEKIMIPVILFGAFVAGRLSKRNSRQ